MEAMKASDAPSQGARLLDGALLVATETVERDPEQPRRDWRTDWVYNPKGDSYQRQDVQYTRLEELAESIRAVGILQPLVVRAHPELPGHYVVIAGNRRLRAAQLAGLREVPVVVREAPGIQVRIVQLIENLHRQALTPMDEARAYDELMTLRGIRATEVARMVHVSPQHVLNRLRVLHDDVLRDAVERRQIGASVAAEIKKLTVEEADELRRRVQGGERLQMGAIEEVRQRLAQSGVVNPRRKLAPDDDDTEHVSASPGPAAVPRMDASPGVEEAVAEVERLAPWRIAPLAPLGAAPPPPHASERARAGAAMPSPTDTTARPMPVATRHTAHEPNRATPLADNGMSSREQQREEETLEALVNGLDDGLYATVTAILDYGVRHGWSSAGLLHGVSRVRRRRRG